MVTEQQVLDQIPMLRRSARRLCRNRLDAEDLLQDSLIRCLKWRESCHTAPKSWCYTIMRNEWATQCGDNSYRRKGETSWAWREIGHSSLPEHVHASQALDRITTLPAHHQETLSAWLSLDDYSDVAKHLGVKLGTVKSRISRLREALGSETEGPG